MEEKNKSVPDNEKQTAKSEVDSGASEVMAMQWRQRDLHEILRTRDPNLTETDIAMFIMRFETKPYEYTIYYKYGEVGLLVYDLLADTTRTEDSIMRRTGINKSKLAEILAFMKELGIIKSFHIKVDPLDNNTKSEDASTGGLKDPDLFFEDRDFAPRHPELSPVEKIVSDKYGDIGLQVYSLINGARTAEEIMRITGLTEPKLVEILDFMDEQGIIKLDYPKGGSTSKDIKKTPFK